MTTHQHRNAWLWRHLQSTASSSSFRARRADLHRILGSSERTRSLELVLLAEMTARPMVQRGLEWIVYCMVKFLHLPPRCEPKTRGPLQLRGAPSCFRTAVILAAFQLPDDLVDLDDLARLWSGAATRQPGSLVGYGEVLRSARRVLAECYQLPPRA